MPTKKEKQPLSVTHPELARSKSTFEVKSIKELMRLTEEFEDQ